jgi:hypothetical protein
VEKVRWFVTGFEEQVRGEQGNAKKPGRGDVANVV